jgi:hypothetical protein
LEEETKEVSKARGEDVIVEKLCKLVNFTFIYGCKPMQGVFDNTKFVEDVINVFKSEAEIESNSFLLPDIFQKV